MSASQEALWAHSLLSRVHQGIEPDANAYRQRQWAAVGFTLPPGLPGAPGELIGLQAEMLAQIHRSNQSDGMFACPVELIWGRMVPGLRAGPWSGIVETALLRIYAGRAYFGTYLQALRTGVVFSDVVGLGNSPPMSDQQQHAMIGAAIVCAYTVRERCLDLVRRVLAFHRGGSADVGPRVEHIDTSIKTIGAAIGTLSGASRAAAEVLIQDHLPAIIGGQPLTAADDAAWKLLRDEWSHGRDQDLTAVTEATLDSVGAIMSYTYGWTTWLLLNDTLGASCPEWPLIS